MADKVIIITGGGNGIGLSIVQSLIESPHVSHTVAVDLNVEKLLPLARERPGRLSVLAGDVRDPDTNAQAVKQALQHGKGITTLILNAATYKPIGSIGSLTVDQWKTTFDVNVFAQLHLIRAAWQHLIESHGSILMTSSRVCLQPTESWTCYALTKAALNYLCSCIPLEDSRVRCLSITPGAVDTDMQTEMREAAEGSEAMKRFLSSLKAEGRLLKPEQPAAAFVKIAETGVPDEMNGKTLNWDVIVGETSGL